MSPLKKKKTQLISKLKQPMPVVINYYLLISVCYSHVEHGWWRNRGETRDSRTDSLRIKEILDFFLLCLEF